jgi:hypothetical protein
VTCWKYLEVSINIDAGWNMEINQTIKWWKADGWLSELYLVGATHC